MFCDCSICSLSTHFVLFCHQARSPSRYALIRTRGKSQSIHQSTHHLNISCFLLLQISLRRFRRIKSSLTVVVEIHICHVRYCFNIVISPLNIASPVALSPTTYSTEDAFETVPVPPIDGVVVEGAEVFSVSDLGYAPSDLVMQGVELIHQTSGLPYWATIVAITFTARSLLLPLALTAMRNSARMANCKPELDIIKERMEVNISMFFLFDPSGDLYFIFRPIQHAKICTQNR